MKPLSSLWLWLSPLAVGVAAFVWPAPGAGPASSAAAGPEQAGRPERREAPHRQDAAAALEQARGDVEAAREERKKRLAARTPEERRAEFLELMRQLKPVLDGKGLGGIEDVEEMRKSGLALRRQDELSEEMGREEGLDAMRWLEKQDPDCLLIALKAWSERSPLEAFDYLAECGRSCHEPSFLYEMLSPMLRARAESGGGAALLDAVRRTPWPLFASGGSAPDFELGGIDPRLWVSSGAAEYLSEQGVATEGVVQALVRDAPDLALRAWADGAQAVPWQRDPALKELIRAAEGDDGTAAGIRSALSQAAPETQELLRARLTTALESQLDPADAEDVAAARRLWGGLYPGEEPPWPAGSMPAKGEREEGGGR